MSRSSDTFKNGFRVFKLEVTPCTLHHGPCLAQWQSVHIKDETVSTASASGNHRTVVLLRRDIWQSMNSQLQTCSVRVTASLLPCKNFYRWPTTTA